LAAGGAAPVANLAALVARLAVQAVVLGLLAYAWQLVLPLNKKLWTPSYVLLSTSFAMLALAALLYALEGGAARAGSAAPTPRWARCFEVFGRNPLFIFVLAGLVPRVLALVRWPDGVDAAGQLQWISPWGWAWRELFMPLGQALAGDPRLGSLLQAGVYLGLYGALAAWMDRRRLYIRV
jgi:predicted acyltransferase